METFGTKIEKSENKNIQNELKTLKSELSKEKAYKNLDNKDYLLEESIENIIINKQFDIEKIMVSNPNLSRKEVNFLIRWTELIEEWEIDKAFYLFDEIIKLNQKNNIIYDLLLSNYKYSENIDIINTILAKNPENYSLLEKKYKIIEDKKLLNESNEENIIYTLNKLISLNPNTDKYYIKKAELFIEEKNYLEALHTLDEWIKLVDTNKADFLYIFKWSVLRNMAYYDEAIKNYKKAIEVSIDNYLIYGDILEILQIQWKNGEYLSYSTEVLNLLEKAWEYEKALDLIDRILNMQDEKEFVERKLKIEEKLLKKNESETK